MNNYHINYKNTSTINRDKRAFLGALVYSVFMCLCAAFLAHSAIWCVMWCAYPVITLCAIMCASGAIICVISSIIDTIKKYKRI